jgi:hypothetical protein
LVADAGLVLSVSGGDDKVAGTLRVPWRFGKVCEFLASNADRTRSVPATLDRRSRYQPVGWLRSNKSTPSTMLPD